jgi:WD40 repeat protein
MMPEQISSYRLEGEIARGGMGIVYRGVHTVFEEVVAIKAIFPELMLSQDLRDRFLNEARIQRRLQHANIVQIREFLVERDRFYIVMELIQGETLAQRLCRCGGPMTASEAIGICRQALEGLGFAHAQGVIHRDIKPSNIMLTREGVAKLTDFGIARGIDTAKRTRTGIALGTAAYMSPEQIQGAKLDHRTDIYSMGITLYEMLTGRVPFGRPKDSDSDFPILTAHTTQPPPPPRQFAPGIPLHLEATVLKALAKKPEDRFQTCGDFQSALGQGSALTADVMAALRSRPVEPAGPLPGVPGSRGASEPEAHSPRLASPPRSGSRGQELKPRTAKLAAKEKSGRVWLWAVTLTLLALAIAGGAGRRILGTPGEYKLKQTLTGHQGEVTSVALSPDGRLLASGSVDRTVKLWDVATRQLKQTLTGHENYVDSVAFSPDGHLLASGSTDATLKIWEVATGDLKQSLSGNGDSVLSVAFSPDGRLLASGTWAKTIELWDVTRGTLVRTLTGHQAPVSSVTFSPDGRLLASGSDDKTIKFWDVASGGEEQTLRGHKGWVRSVAFSPDGRLLASGSHDMTIKVWDLASGKEKQRLTGHGYDVESVAFSVTSRLIASGSRDQTIKLWLRVQ